MGLVASLGATLIVASPTSAHAVATPVAETLAAAKVAAQRVAVSATLVIRVVRGDTSWELAERYCGRGAAYANGGVTVRGKDATGKSVVRAPAAIWPGDWATVSCAKGGVAVSSSRPARGWVAPLAGSLLVYGDGRAGGKGGCWLAQRPGHLHQGIDIGRRTDTPIRASYGGLVTYAGWDRGAGWMVRIVHSGGTMTKYFHMVRPPMVRTNQRVSTGQPVGHVGSTGASSEPHLHMETWQHTDRRWRAVDPIPFLRDRGIAVGGCTRR